jgi:hypothetical protein
MSGYHVVKRYFLPEPTWLKAPHWNPVRYDTWQEARDQYIKERRRNPLALDVRGLAAEDINVIFCGATCCEHS